LYKNLEIMVSKETINQASKRNIKNGSPFDALIEKPSNQKIELKSGNTFYSVKMMSAMVRKFFKQVAPLSKKLQGASLQETCNNIHHFLYNYIQYETDTTLQKLRSPANSWHRSRETGIDCKSYSIFAAALLQNLNIKSYIRQIKQPLFNPTKYTHVYIIVPINQITGGLENGYYIIDGTIKSNIEARFSTKNDLYMDTLPHLGLNGVSRKRKTTATKKKPVATKKKPVRTKKNNMVRDGLIGVGLGVAIMQILK